MKVLLVTESPAGGAGRHVADLANGLCRSGCRVHLIYSDKRIDQGFTDWLDANPNINRKQIRMHQTPHFSDVSVIRQVLGYVKKNGPFDIVHAHSSKAGAIVRTCRFSPRTNIIYTPHCIFSMNPRMNQVSRLLAAVVERCLAVNCEAVIAVSPAERDHLVDLGISPEKAKYIPNGISQYKWWQREDARLHLSLPADKIIVGFLGRLAKEKDPGSLLHAFKIIANHNQHVHLAMVGTGPLENHYRDLADKLKISDQISWLGYQTPEIAMPTFDVFVLPSRSESMPYVLLEAAAAGVPIVATRVGSTDLTVKHDVNGYLVEPAAPASLAAPIQTLLQDRKLRKNFAAASRQRSTHFTAAAMVDKTLALYRQLQINMVV